MLALDEGRRCLYQSYMFLRQVREPLSESVCAAELHDVLEISRAQKFPVIEVNSMQGGMKIGFAQQVAMLSHLILSDFCRGL